MRRLAMLAVAVVLGGCGGSAGPAPPAPQPPAATHGWTSLPWTLLDVEGRRLEIAYEGGGCVVDDGDVPVRAVASEGPDTVTIAVYAANANPCAGVGLYGRKAISLRAPLGDRRLLHAPADQA